MVDLRSFVVAAAVKRALLKNRPRLDDATLAGAMVEAMVGAENHPASALKVMLTILTELVRRVITQLPESTRCDDQGRALYNLTEVARSLGLSDAEAGQMRDYLRDQGVQSVDPAQTHTLN